MLWQQVDIILDTLDHWTFQAPARDEYDHACHPTDQRAVSFCLSGAVMKALELYEVITWDKPTTTNIPYVWAMEQIARAIKQLFPDDINGWNNKESEVVRWNDHNIYWSHAGNEGIRQVRFNKIKQVLQYLMQQEATHSVAGSE